MPELCGFYDIVIEMVYSDDAQLQRPHFRVYYNGCEASWGLMESSCPAVSPSSS